MASKSAPWQAWPALAELGRPPFAPLRCERAVWGREPEAAGAEPHWLATSSGFGGKAEGLGHALVLGGEDAPCKTLLWRSSGAVHHAVHCYPDRAPTPGGHQQLEKQLLEWRRPRDCPAVVGALVLLSQAERLDDGIWWGKPSDGGGFADGYHLVLPPDETSEIPFDDIDLPTTIEAGCRELVEATDAATLAALYAQILAGAKGISLPGLGRPLSGAALAALLLPLPRAKADRLSMVAWWPSRLADWGQAAHPWDLVLGGEGLDPSQRQPSPADQPPSNEAKRMAEAVLGCNPGQLRSVTATPRPGPPPRQDQAGAQRLVLWGLAAAGKTAYLAQLYLQLEHATGSDWRVYPGPGSLAYFQSLRGRMYTQNQFPPPAQLGSVNSVLCRLVNDRTGAQALIEVEDRSGEEFRQHSDAVKQALASADGLVLLFDPLQEVASQHEAFRNALDLMSLSEDRVEGRDTRPVAFCLTKADAFVTTTEDYRRAIEDPAGFVQSRVGRDILLGLRHHFANTRLFPVSAAGVWAEFGAVTPAVFFDEDLNLRIGSHTRPLHLLDPLAWVLDRLGPPGAAGPAR